MATIIRKSHAVVIGFGILGHGQNLMVVQLIAEVMGESYAHVNSQMGEWSLYGTVMETSWHQWGYLNFVVWSLLV